MGVDTPASARFARLAPHLWTLALANLAANIAIVVTGAAVRLTGSGLGCPTWPKCSEDSYTTHGELGIHGAIEFGNRLMTFLLAAIAIACFLAAVGARHKPAIRWSFLIGLGIPAQALIGGVTVLTQLNPWVVSFHFLASMLIIMFCIALLDELRSPDREMAPPLPRALAFATFGIGWVVLYLGTVLTGAGPHAGDTDARRIDLDTAVMSQVHAISVYVLVAVTAALLVVAVRSGMKWLAFVTTAVLTLEVLQGILGWVQHFMGLPILLVALHMLLAASLAAGFARVALAVLPHHAVGESWPNAAQDSSATRLFG